MRCTGPYAVDLDFGAEVCIGKVSRKNRGTHQVLYILADIALGINTQLIGCGQVNPFNPT